MHSRSRGILQVSPKTIARWAQHGLLPCQRTLGGHRRYPEPAIRELAASLHQEVRAA
jgi:DNA-binding transcriptional MerR regulator